MQFHLKVIIEGYEGNEPGGEDLEKLSKSACEECREEREV